MKRKSLLMITSGLVVAISLASAVLFINNVSGTIRIFKSSITIDFSDNTFTYTDETLSSLNYSVTEGNLFDGDHLKFTFNLDIKEAGSYLREVFDYQIISKAGKDVTSSYIINEKFNEILIEKRNITVQTQSTNGSISDYQNEKVTYKEVSVVDGSLASNHKIVAENFNGNFKKHGNYQNTCTVKVLNQKDEEVTKNYNIKYYFGTIFVSSKTSEDDSDSETTYEGETQIEENGPIDKNEFSESAPKDISKSEYLQMLKTVVFRYYKKTSGGQFIRTGCNSGYYNINYFKKCTPYTIKYGVNPDEFISILLQDKVKHDLGTMDYSNFESRNYDFHLNYPLYNEMQTDDCFPIISDLKTTKVDFEGLQYNYINNHKLLDDVKVSDETFIKEELNYREYVYKNYTGMDQTNLSFLKEYVEKNGLNGNSIYEIAVKITKLFTKEFRYCAWNNYSFHTPYQTIAFLDKYKVGRCVNFSIAGTLLFRAMGYAARSIDGYGVSGIGEIDVTAGDGHTKTQVYMDGKGWVDFEFTCANALISEGSPNAPISSEEKLSDDTLYDLVITTESVTKEYDGKELRNTEYKVSGENKLKSGHKLYAYCNNVLTNCGNITNSVRYFVLDNNSNDVTSNYCFKEDFGTLSITSRKLEIHTDNYIMPIDQSNYKVTYNLGSTSLVDGDYINEVEYIKYKTKGTYDAIVIIRSILNSNKEDVTSNYDISYFYGKIEVI